MIPPIPVFFPIPPWKRSVSGSHLPFFILHLGFKISRTPHPASILSYVSHPAKTVLDPRERCTLQLVTYSSSVPWHFSAFKIVKFDEAVGFNFLSINHDLRIVLDCYFMVLYKCPASHSYCRSLGMLISVWLDARPIIDLRHLWQKQVSQFISPQTFSARIDFLAVCSQLRSLGAYWFYTSLRAC